MMTKSTVRIERIRPSLVAGEVFRSRSAPVDQ